MNTPKLKSIREELKACRAAFRKYPNATHAWFIHHGKLVERINRFCSTIDCRIKYISSSKLLSERANRFRKMRPVKPHQGQRLSNALYLKQWPASAKVPRL
jgi:hypothetical protein